MSSGAGARIAINKRRPFSAVPDDVLTDKRLSLAARAALAYIIGRPDGWHYYVAQIRSALGVSDAAWRRIREEMRAAGYYTQTRERLQDGRLAWKIVVSDTPADAYTTCDFTIRGKPMDGEAMDGVAIHGGPPDRAKESEQRKETDDVNKGSNPPKRESGGRGAPPVRGRRAPTLSEGGGNYSHKYKTDGQTGISLQEGNAQDKKVLAEIQQYSPDVLAAAVAAAAADEPSGRAFPSAVLRLLRRAARAASPPDAPAPAWARRAAPVAPARREIDITEYGKSYDDDDSYPDRRSASASTA